MSDTPNNKGNKRDVETLYRAYQKHRDAMPSTALKTIIDAADKPDAVEAIRHREARIQTILQSAESRSQAQRAHTRTQQQDNKSQNNKPVAKTSKRPSILSVLSEKLNDFLSSGAAMPATAFAVAAVIAVSVFVRLPSDGTGYQGSWELAYLSDCQNCQQLAMESTITLRSLALPGSTQDKSAYLDSRFGRLAMDLKVLSQAKTDYENATAALLKTLQKLSVKHSKTPIIEHLDTALQAQEKKPLDTLQFLDQHFADSQLFAAGQWLERLRISSAAETPQDRSSQTVSALNNIDQVLQTISANASQNPQVGELLSQLQSFNPPPSSLSQAQLQQLSRITKELMSAMGI